jgi:hypothetical protein
MRPDPAACQPPQPEYEGDQDDGDPRREYDADHDPDHRLVAA